jgi:hypothetical protein
VNNVWKNTNTALIIVKYESLDELKNYRDAIKDSGLNVNNCELIAIVETKKEREALDHSSLAVFLSPQDINFIGRLKNSEATKALSRKYDLLLVTYEVPKRLAKLFGRTKVGFKAGVNCTKLNYSVNLETDSTSPQHLINFAKETLEKVI